MRTVTVELIAKVQVYKREMDSAGRSTKGVKEELDDAARAGKACATANEAAARSAKDLGDAADKAGNDLAGMGKDAGALEKKILSLRGEYQRMVKDFAEGGGEDRDLLKKIKTSKRDLGQLERLQKELLKFADKTGDEVGGQLGESMMRKAATASIAMRPLLIGGIVGIAAVASPMLAGVISSAVIGGVGVGGIIGGVALAARDPRVQDAGAKLGQQVLTAFGKAAEPFVGPTLEAIDMLGRIADDVAGDMRKAFEEIAPALVPFTRDLGAFVKSLMPGIIEAMKGARPVLAAIGAELPKIGRALSEFLSTLAKDPRGAIMAFTAFSRLIQGTIILVGQLIAVLSKVYTVLAPAVSLAQGDMSAFAHNVANLAHNLSGAEKAGKETADSIHGLGTEASKAKQQVTDLSSAIGDFIGIQLGVDQMQVRWTEGLRELNRELREGKRTLSLNTEEGTRNRAAMLDMIATAEDFRQRIFAQTGDLAGANVQYQANIATLRKMGEAAGFSKTELDELFAPYVNGPRIATTEFQFPGLLQGLARVRELARLLGSNAAAVQFLNGEYISGRRWGGITEHARMGLLRDAQVYSAVSTGARYAFAEPATGGEAFVPRKGDTSRSLGILNRAAGWYGHTIAPRGGSGGTQTVVHEHRHTVVIQGREMISGFRREVDLAGGTADNLVGRSRS